MKKVLVGMSGGVDSAVTAYLLQKEGYEVCGVTLRTWAPDDGSEGRCCEIDDARRISNTLGIRFYPLNCLAEFSQKVVDPFVQSYLRGETPNPCIECNRYLKWERMLYAAKVMGADYVATGHYAHVLKLENGRYTVKKANYAAKDQTYMLYKLTQEQLAATLMPLGKYTKEEVRRIAEEADLPVAHKPDSQEICFVTDGHYADFIEDYADKKNAQALACAAEGSCGPSAASLLHVPGPGNFVDEAGNVLGTHKGITHYTIGQRKGLGIALGRPVYVKEIRPGTDEVVLSDEPALFSRIVNVRDVNFLSIPGMAPGEQLRAKAKVRYHHEASPAVLEMQEDGCIRITFDRPVRAAAPGQSSVFYDENDCVIGGGIIF
jgi:tRNA-specific 2-thiouridylase